MTTPQRPRSAQAWATIRAKDVPGAGSEGKARRIARNRPKSLVSKK